MKFVFFYHSLISDWNHGNAHFLRGIVSELIARGHTVDVYEPLSGWSLTNLQKEHGEEPIHGFSTAYPQLRSTFYSLENVNLDEALAGTHVVIVHEWNAHELVQRVGQQRVATPHFRLFFHDTHHRSVTDPESMHAYDLSHYDGVLAFGDVIRDIYLRQGWVRQAWTWREAADIRLFHPLAADQPREGDLVWIGNWGDEERTQELQEFLLDPVQLLRLRARAYGVRYPFEAQELLAKAGIAYGGWLPNYRVPEILARFRVTVHIPRRPYRATLPGIPTIRPFEALACGIPLVTAPWDDVEGLFTPGADFLVARSGREMAEHLQAILNDRQLARALSVHGRSTILARHTCAHRVDELLSICRALDADPVPSALVANTVESVGSQASVTDSERRLPCHGLRIAFFGSSLVSSYWNGAATYYRGIIRALSELGHQVTFFEPDAFERQAHRDMPDPTWAKVVVYPAQGEEGVSQALEAARSADIVIKASGVGVFDALLEQEVLTLQRAGTLVLFWDVDAPATLERVMQNPNDPFLALIPRYDFILTYGGGPPVVQAYRALGARECFPIYNALDPLTHYPVARDKAFHGTLGFLGNRLPDREERVGEFFFKPARLLPKEMFLIGGSGWHTNVPELPNVRYLGHVYTRDHNIFNCSPRAVLNINRDSMARWGYSPATRVFETAGAGACLIMDAWDGIELFLEPESEVLIVRSGEDVAEQIDHLSEQRARQIGSAALRRIRAEHTYAHRAAQLTTILQGGK